MSRKSRNKSYRIKKTGTRRNKTSRNKRNKLKYNMIGCSKKCKCSCHHKGGSSPIGGLPIKGGGCFGPLVGSPYSPTTGGNYYELPESSAYNQNMKLRGGSMLPTNLVNVGNQVVYGSQSLYNGLLGYKAPTNPAPYVQNKI